MPQLVVLLLVIAGVLAAGTGLFRWNEGPGSLVWLVLGAGLIAVAYVGDRGRLERKRRREQACAGRKKGTGFGPISLVEEPFQDDAGIDHEAAQYRGDITVNKDIATIANSVVPVLGKTFVILSSGQRYKLDKYLDQNGYSKPMTSANFYREFKAMFTCVKRNDGNYYLGVKSRYP